MDRLEEYVRLWQQYPVFRQRDDLLSKDAIRTRSDFTRMYRSMSVEQRYQGYSQVMDILGASNES